MYARLVLMYTLLKNSMCMHTCTIGSHNPNVELVMLAVSVVSGVNTVLHTISTSVLGESGRGGWKHFGTLRRHFWTSW